MYDILSFDMKFGKILQEMQVIVCRKQYLESTASKNQNTISDLCFRGAPIEDLCLDFTLPGYPDYILKPGAENTLVCQSQRTCFATLPFGLVSLSSFWLYCIG